MPLVEIAEGHTDPIDFDLPLDGEVTESLSGATVECQFWTKTGTAKSSPGSTSIVDASTRQVRFTPTSGATFVNSESPYKFRIQVTRGDGKIYHHPTGKPLEWFVYKP